MHRRAGSDANGNRTEQCERNGAVTGDVEQVTTYAYDEADRLTSVHAPDRDVTYTLDAVGNRLTEQVRMSGVLVSESTLSYNERDQLVERDDPVRGMHVTLAYDANGNVRTQTDASGTRTFTYDARDRLLTLAQPNAPPLVFDYQSDGLRLAKRQAGSETRYQYDQQSLIAETNAIGNTLARYHYGATQLVSRTDAGSPTDHRHYLLDALQTPIGLLTQQGAVSARTRYDAWGAILAQQAPSGIVTTPDPEGTNAELASTDLQPIGFTGYLKDTESGLYYAKARYYDPRIARFTTEDPERGDILQPPSLHRYLYAYANPGGYVDPDGRCAEPVTFTLCAAGLSAVIGWAGSVIHDELTSGASFSEAATNPRNLRNGLAVGGVVLSGGALGVPATASFVALGGGTDVAMQMNLEGKAYDQVDYERAVANGGLTAGGGAVLGVGLGSAHAYVATGSKLVGGGLVGAGAIEGGHLIGEGLASSDYGKVALGTSFAGLSLAGGTTIPRMPSPRMSAAELDVSLNALQPKIGATDAVVAIENHVGATPTLSMETGPHRAMRLRSDVPGQSHHLNQDAAYRNVIPRNEGVAVKLEGNTFSGPGSPHFEAHASLENFWAPYRTAGDAPTNLEYNLALKQSLEAAGYSPSQAQKLTREAVRNRLNYGLLGGEPVPRVPAPIRQRKQQERQE